MLLIYTLFVKDYLQSETWFKEKGLEGEIGLNESILNLAQFKNKITFSNSFLNSKYIRNAKVKFPPSILPLQSLFFQCLYWEQSFSLQLQHH